MSMKSAWVRWGVCSLVVLAMIAVLGGCSKKEGAETETTETTEMAGEPAASPMAGTYSASMATGTLSLTLNADNSAMMSMQAMENTPASVENGTWAAGAAANMVDVTFQKQMGDSTMSMTLNFEAKGDTLALTNGATVGMPGVALVKQH